MAISKLYNQNCNYTGKEICTELMVFDFSKIHRGIIASPKILSLIGDNLSVGQRVHVAGRLEASTFKNSNEQLRQSFMVRVNELYASKVKEAEPNKQVDLNSVFFLGHIASDVIHYDNAVTFSVSSHFTSR